jgi:hypothetical protein
MLRRTQEDSDRQGNQAQEVAQEGQGKAAGEEGEEVDAERHDRVLRQMPHEAFH